jgi:hypothetical protein
VHPPGAPRGTLSARDKRLDPFVFPGVFELRSAWHRRRRNAGGIALARD